MILRLVLPWLTNHLAWPLLGDLALALFLVGIGLAITWDFPDPK